MEKDMPIRMTDAQREEYQCHGCLIIRNAFDSDRVQSLAHAVERILDRALASEFSDPPFKWIDQERRLPDCIPDLFHPDKYDAAFGEWFDAEIIPRAEGLLDAPVRCSWLTLFSSGSGYHYGTPWHRDHCDMDGPAEVPVLQRDLLRQCFVHAPLLPEDRFLQIVPASHTRTATEAETTACGLEGKGEMPGQFTIELDPGDIAIRHGNLIHRGWNPDGKPRQSLISSFWWADVPVWSNEASDRQAMLSPGHLDRMPPLTRTCFHRYLEAFPECEPRQVTKTQ